MTCAECRLPSPTLFATGKCWTCEIRRPEINDPDHWLKARPEEAK